LQKEPRPTLPPCHIKRPRGNTLKISTQGFLLWEWKFGKPFAWDATCRDTFAPTYLHRSCVETGAVAIQAETQKSAHYQELGCSYHFVPVAVETGGTFGPQTRAIFREIGAGLRSMSGDPRSTYFLCQHVSVCIQRGNTEAILGTFNNNELSPLFN
jgi:hypothetical protein